MESRHKKGLHSWTLKSKGGIELAINDVSSTDIDSELLVPVMRFDHYVLPTSRGDLENLSKMAGTVMHTFKDLLTALKKEISAIAKNIVGIKIGLAYQRTLNFEKVTYNEAERVFNRIYRTQSFERKEIMPFAGRAISTYIPRGIDFEEAKTMQDYIVHSIIQQAEKYKLPIQIHTGLQDRNENIISNSNPVLLTNLFREYNNVKFDIFHAGYPYFRELATLAKNYQNVYPDLCWMHVISPSATRIILSEWLDTVPLNKILAFGGDYHTVEGVYVHLIMARKNISKVLHEKVESDEVEFEKISHIASSILRDNAIKLFRLKI
jgi:predicted TIM-barrel fold metal-dependent hydrolase